MKAVFFDIDGTIWDAHMWIPESTKRAIRALRENGHLTFICSGRTRAFIQAEELLDLGFDGIIAGHILKSMEKNSFIRRSKNGKQSVCLRSSVPVICR